MQDQSIRAFTKGIHNLLDSELIPKEAGQDGENWITQDGKLKLVGGRQLVGAEGLTGTITGEIFGYKVDGTKVHWRKAGSVIQYLNGSTWTDVVTGLTASYDVTFTNYQSLAGTFTFAFGLDGIYKFHNANPASYISLYDATKNFKGYAFIDKGRSFLWNNPKDKTGLYGSYIDAQNTTTYTTVTNETVGTGNASQTTFTGTLAFKAGGATRNCFGVTINDITPTTETFTDNYDGTLTGSAGGTGTINYISGAFSVTFITPPSAVANNIKASYQWEDSNILGVTDFTHSTTRTASQGFVIRQDEGGDAIVNVLVGLDGNYYSLKKQSAYQLSIDTDDLAITNLVYRKDIGSLFLRGSVSTGKGIVFMNMANLDKPEMTILQRNPLGGNVEPIILFPHFKFSNYTFNDCAMETFDRYILVSCKSSGATNNDSILLCDLANNTVDITSYNARTFAKDAGILYIGSPLIKSVYKLYAGFDDDGLSIENFWITKNDLMGTESLKKTKKLRLKGNIYPDQYYEVYASYDNDDFFLIGTVRGDGTYVDSSSPQSIGSNGIGNEQIGGSDDTIVYPYYLELKIKTPKFRVRAYKFIAQGIGYVDIDSLMDHRVFEFENRLPSKYRSKQNVSLDGQTTDQANPSF